MSKVSLLTLFVLAVAPIAGCSWFQEKIGTPVKGVLEENITKPVKGLIKRRLTVTSDPPGADVYVNDVYQGKTPLTLNYHLGVRDVMKGMQVFVEKEGFLPMRRDISTASQTITFRLIKKRARR